MGARTGTLIVGGSLAGLRVAEALRKLGDDRPIDIVCEEAHLPYDRPPLSKGVLTGSQSYADIRFRSDQALSESAITYRASWRAVGVDLARRVVRSSDMEIEYEHLVIASGARARELGEPSGLDGVHTIRTVGDATRIREQLSTARNVVVVGAGFIGAEVASAARTCGLEVTVVEALASPLARSVGERVGVACAALHAEHGTQLLCGVGVDSLDGDGHVEAVVLSDGTRIPADLVVVGIGVIPNVEWLDGSGLSVSNGVACDQYLCAGRPEVFALGDVAAWPNPRYGETMRIEHWTTTVEQALIVAHNILNPDSKRVCDVVPYFWSDQYGHRIQFAGRAGADEIVEVQTPAARYVALYRRDDRLIGALTIDGTPLLMQLRGRMATGKDDWIEAVEFASATT
jgi:NAD(P)H-nitrite reductase